MSVTEQIQLNEIVKRLKNTFNPQRLFLFGSRAKGSAHELSDYDFLLVVEKDEAGRVANMIEGKKITRDLPVSADVFVYSKEEFNEWKEEFNSIPEVAINTGVELDLKNF